MRARMAEAFGVPRYGLSRETFALDETHRRELLEGDWGRRRRDDPPAATTLRIEDLQRAIRVMREMQLPPNGVMAMERERELLMRAEAEQRAIEFGAFCATAYFPCDCSHCRQFRADPEAAARGEKLLREWLSRAQLEQYDRCGGFEVKGCDTGIRYRILKGRAFNVIELDETGRERCQLCFGPEGALVIGDVMLAQKVALETNERAALAVANRRHDPIAVRPGFFRQLFGS